MKQFRILALNPGSTSTKIAGFEGDREFFRRNVKHDASELARYARVIDQLRPRKETILRALAEEGIDIRSFDAYAGRGGGLVSCVSGVYEVIDKVREHERSGKYGGNHPAALGGLISAEFAQEFGGRAFIVNGPDTDEFCDEARLTGFSEVFRASHTHALNQKETALVAAKALGKAYGELNLIIAHIGGGVSVTAHRRGRMIDSNDIIDGDGPMAPTRSGALPVKPFMDLCYSGKWTRDEMYTRMTKTGGFVDHLGTSDVLEVKEMIRSGDRYAKLVYDAFIYQIAKNIGSMAAVLCGTVDAIVLTGGIARDEELVEKLKVRAGFIAPFLVYPGEFEMEALAKGALRVLRGEEEPVVYTGEPVFTDFSYLKK